MELKVTFQFGVVRRPLSGAMVPMGGVTSSVEPWVIFMFSVTEGGGVVLLGLGRFTMT